MKQIIALIGKMAGITIVAILTSALFATAHATYFSYPTQGDGNPSILVQADFSLRIEAVRGGKVIATYIKDSSDAADVNILGATGPRSFIYLRFSSSLSWAFIFDKKSERVTMDRLVQFVPKNIFPKITSMSDPETFDDPGVTEIPSGSKSYACTREATRVYAPQNAEKGNTNFTVSVTLKDFRIQAYDLVNGKFGPAVHCSTDEGSSTSTEKPSTKHTSAKSTPETSTSTSVTTTAKTTKSPTTTAKPSPDYSTNTYSVKEGNETCISLSGKILFDIKYKSRVDGENKTETAHLGIPANFSTTGSCGKNAEEQTLVVHFNRNWIAEFVFALKPKDRKSLKSLYSEDTNKTQADLDYMIKNITLEYTTQHEQFPNAVEPEGTPHIVSVSNAGKTKLPEKKSGSGFYKCSSPEDYKMDDNVQMKISDLKFKAFNKDKDGKPSGKPAVCDADKDNSSDEDWLPVLGWLILVLFIIFLIIVVIILLVRHVRRNTYQRLS